MKMVLLKMKNGKQILDMSEIGKIIKNLVLVFNFMVMEINMKEVGKMIKEMDRVLFG